MLGEIQDEVNSLLLRIDEITERDISLLEDREKSLRALLDDADRRLKVYTREMDRRANSEKAYQDLGLKAGRPVRAAEPVPPQTTETIPEGVPEPAPVAELPAKLPAEIPTKFPAESPTKFPAESPHFTQAEKQIKADPRPIGEQVRELSLAGFSASLIASKLGISISEAELAVALLERGYNG
jgi:hypothetical protein